MVLCNDIFLLSDIRKHQIFQRIFMMTLFCIIYSKPYQRKSPENLSDLKSENYDLVLEKQKIISELKVKILSRLNISQSLSARRSFNWNDIPEEMKSLLNKESKTENDDENLETIISPLVKMTSCSRNQSVNRECFNATIPNLVIRKITRAKLIAELQSDVETVFRNVAQYRITVNGHEEIYDFVVGNKENENVEIDLLEVFKGIMFDEDELNGGINETTLSITIDGDPNSLPISQIIDVTKMVFEVQYKPPNAIKRSKRSANMCQKNQYFCCTQTMKINIDELQLSNFIIAPRNFPINYCKGDCNNHIQNSSNHAKALNLIRNKATDERKDTRSCCIPYSFSSLTIMYQADDGTLQTAKFNDLIASSCGCL